MSDITDEILEQQKARCGPLFAKWKSILGLHNWSITPTYYRMGWTEDSQPARWTDVAMRTLADYRYLHATIRVNVAEVVGVPDDTLEAMVIHEYMHCLTDAIKRYACGEQGASVYMDGAELERQVTELERAAWYTYQAGQGRELRPIDDPAGEWKPAAIDKALDALDGEQEARAAWERLSRGRPDGGPYEAGGLIHHPEGAVSRLSDGMIRTDDPAEAASGFTAATAQRPDGAEPGESVEGFAEHADLWTWNPPTRLQAGGPEVASAHADCWSREAVDAARAEDRAVITAQSGMIDDLKRALQAQHERADAWAEEVERLKAQAAIEPDPSAARDEQVNRLQATYDEAARVARIRGAEIEEQDNEIARLREQRDEARDRGRKLDEQIERLNEDLVGKANALSALWDRVHTAEDLAGFETGRELAERVRAVEADRDALRRSLEQETNLRRAAEYREGGAKQARDQAHHRAADHEATIGKLRRQISRLVDESEARATEIDGLKTGLAVLFSDLGAEGVALLTASIAHDDRMALDAIRAELVKFQQRYGVDAAP